MAGNESEHLVRYLSYLEADPDNPNLLIDAIQAAISARDLDTGAKLTDHLRALQPYGFDAPYLASVIAMNRSDFAGAAQILEQLIEQHDQPNVRFNLAWSRAMLSDKADLLDVLDDATVQAIPAAAMLKTQLIHEAGDFDRAMDFAKQAMGWHPDDAGLLAAISTLALDVEDVDLARECAMRAGAHPEALAVTALLELEEGNPEQAQKIFDRSLSVRHHNPRAWVGRGLTELTLHNPVQAAKDLDLGAQQFDDHIGSWIAAGWAHYLAGDIAAAQQRFERALAIDPNFAESHGSLAVIAIAKGDQATARREMTTALRLDRQCFSAALAQALLSNDDPARVSEIVNQAMTAPLNDQGLTLARFMAGLTRPTLH